VAFRNSIPERPSPERIQEARSQLANAETLQRSVWLTRRCVADYREQADPSLRKVTAINEIRRRMQAQGRFSVHPPSWHQATNPLDLGYVIIGNELLLPIRFDSRRRAPFAAISCVHNSEQHLSTRPVLDRAPSVR
jgi:hypothetical protein